MATIKRFPACTLEQVVDAWNKGFEGYYFDATTTSDGLTTRLITEGMLPSISIIAFDKDTPIGVILSGKRKAGNVVISWNGGTGVATEYRKKGIGRKMMQSVIDIYHEENVDLATLEAISENTKAISLYEQFGYQVVDQLFHLQHKGSLHNFSWKKDENVKVRFGSSGEIESSSLYQTLAPWQSYWSHGKGIEILVAEDEFISEIRGFVTFKKRFNEDGKVVGVTVLQCEVDETSHRSNETLHTLLYTVFAPFEEEAVRMFAYLQESNKRVMEFANEAGFKQVVGQVYMMKPITEKGEELLKNYAVEREIK